MDISDQISKKLYLSENKSPGRILKIDLRKKFNLENVILMKTNISFLQRIQFDWHVFM